MKGIPFNNNGVTIQCNIINTFRSNLYLTSVYLIASCYRAIIGIFWIIGLSLQGTVLNMISSVLM